MPIAGRIRHLDLDAQDPAAVLDHEIHLIAGLGAPEVQPAARRQLTIEEAVALLNESYSQPE